MNDVNKYYTEFYAAKMKYYTELYAAKMTKELATNGFTKEAKRYMKLANKYRARVQ